MTNKELFKQAIAEAKTIREAALVNAKAALEETLTPHLQSMLASKLEEMAKDEDEEPIAETQDADADENGEKIKEEISLSFPNIIPNDYEFIYPSDKTGNSKSTVSDFTFDIGEIRVWCSDWSIEGYSDVVQVALSSEVFKKFIETEAYKY